MRIRHVIVRKEFAGNRFCQNGKAMYKWGTVGRCKLDPVGA